MVKGSSSGGNPFNGKKFSSEVKKEIVESIIKDPRASKVLKITFTKYIYLFIHLLINRDHPSLKALMEKHNIGRRTIYNYRKKYMTGVPVSESKGRGVKIDDIGAEVILSYWNNSSKKTLNDPNLMEVAKEQAKETLKRRRLNGEVLDNDENITLSVRTIARIINPIKKEKAAMELGGIEV